MSPEVRIALWIFAWMVWTAIFVLVAMTSLVATILVGLCTVGVVIAIGRLHLLKKRSTLAVALGGVVIGLVGGRGVAMQQAAFDAMTPEQHLRAAKYDRSLPDYEVRKHLLAIKAGTPEATEAEKLLLEKDPVAQKTKEAQAAQKEAEEAQTKFLSLTPAEHLAEATKAVQNKQVSEAERHLERIPDDAPEAKKVPALQRKLDKLKAANHAEAEKIAKKLYMDERIKVAESLDQAFLEARINVQHVRAAGDNKTTLAIDYDGCNRVFMNEVLKLVNKIDGFYKFGFKKIVCYGYDSTTSADL